MHFLKKNLENFIHLAVLDHTGRTGVHGQIED